MRETDDDDMIHPGEASGETLDVSWREVKERDEENSTLQCFSVRKEMERLL